MRLTAVCALCILAAIGQCAASCPPGEHEVAGVCVRDTGNWYHEWNRAPQNPSPPTYAVEPHSRIPFETEPAPASPSSRALPPAGRATSPLGSLPGHSAGDGNPGGSGLGGDNPPRRIGDTGYATLTAIGQETDGYGLYSYAILPNDSERAAAFLGELFGSTLPAAGLLIPRSEINVLYLPLQRSKESNFAAEHDRLRSRFQQLGKDFADNFYDYAMAHALLVHICERPTDTMLGLCRTDLSQGPYLFTYAQPASKLEPLPPPLLFVDLTGIAPHGFGQWLMAYREQVRRPDFSDRARIDTFKLRLLKVTLTAADVIEPIGEAAGAVRDFVASKVH